MKLTERKRIVSGVQIEDFLKSYGFYNVVKDYEEYDDFTIVRYVYAPTPFLKPNTPRVEFEVDEDDYGFIGGYIYLNGDKGDNIDLKFMEDLEYFMKNAKWTESKKSTRKSIKESKDLTDLCNAWVIGDVVGKFKNRDYCHKGNDYSVFNIGNIIENALRDNYILEFDGDNKTKSVIFYMVDKDGKNVGSLEIYPDERYEISNYEDGYDLSKLDMNEIADLFYEFQNNKIEYLLSDKRFDFTDKFWYNESKKSTRKSIKESKVDFQSVIDKVIPKEYAKNKNAYKYALSCVESLYNEDEYDSDSAKIYFLNCYISDSFPSWVDELDEEEMDALANALYDGTMKWSDIDSSWLE